MKILKRICLFIAVLFLPGLLASQTIIGEVKTDPGKEKYKINTVVYIENVDTHFDLPEENPVMNQKELQFLPKILPIVVGSTVDFLNSDDVLHNVFSPDSCVNKFNLGTWKKGEVRSVKYDKIECVSVLLCNVHPEMEAYVIVLQNPFFAITNEEGEFIIENVPPGVYNLKVWNEKLNAKVKQITVGEIEEVIVNFHLKR
ncbi:carboxypeptidase regulatory-like domain-containing protein [Labilibaculum sp. DW002]|uniref:Carboxypeptidase regulatory-like domain-containing protein n=1 Tax=Paralabilibaculum antarcticum TaxID=2912572 RepID=A0ABT5VQA9_9BACT|nr:carboxypeptidase regulatory-like domain-containing protein [Labilibaculum sp. DW002]MDE5417625.1 carboxypeptidase regulatory-like domain-containing protein [Labilibaculum sp. DW002]